MALWLTRSLIRVRAWGACPHHEKTSLTTNYDGTNLEPPHVSWVSRILEAVLVALQEELQEEPVTSDTKKPDNDNGICKVTPISFSRFHIHQHFEDWSKRVLEPPSTPSDNTYRVNIRPSAKKKRNRQKKPAENSQAPAAISTHDD
ncbi:hypothetical protein BIW11_10852 [Tropilaelaps mercedesae]|uniref:Uncharacterized protein n=1 Tax=Tropilaelaps mercedesae TaxID=418985 RepID=A0A1V9XDX0_9ACAR|nr:hypothetical protein BIW11_10852 [Tropilaelaps mercedesae]